MARLWLVRHGQAGSVDGDYDQLSPTGLAQSEQLAQYFSARDLRFEAAQSGFLKRQQSTLATLIAAQPHCVQLPYDHALDELPFQALVSQWQMHRAEGRDLSLGEQFPAVLKATLRSWIAAELPDPPLPWRTFKQAAIHWLEQTRRHFHTQNDILVVSSGGTIGTLIAALVDAPDASMLKFNLQLRNTALCEIALGPRRSHLVSFNALPHLETRDRSHLITLI